MSDKHTRGLMARGFYVLKEWNRGMHTVASVDHRLPWHENHDCEDDEREANATLYAAAPDLLDALEELCDWQNGPPLATYEKGWTSAMEKARAAIAKARGEQ